MNFENNKYRIFFVLGAPGSGKNTQCDRLIEKYNFVHFSCGDLLRDAIKQNNAESNLINELIKEGKIVPVRITCNLLKSAIDKSGGPNNIYIVDGFPRNQENLEGFREVFGDKADVKGVLFLDCPEEVCTKRILSRSSTSGRVDDNEISLKKRFNVFLDETMPTIEELSKFTRIIKVKSDRDMGDVFSDICIEFDNILLA